MRVSVVINTLNRADALAQCLDALRYLDYEDFEVVVVNGPSTDHTAEVLAAYEGRIKVGTCPEPNLSQSRNVGIALAAGEIVAFIDDDAYPDPAWLDGIVEGYSSDETAGVGGPVLDYTGARYQVRYLRSDRFGSSTREDEHGENPTFLSVPGASRFPSMLGANSSFRRDVLTAMGGFDEEYEYYLDETDVCVRLIDAGYVVRITEDGFVFHKFLPSTIRRADRIARNRYSVIKNSIYFALRHRRAVSFGEVCEGIANVLQYHRADMRDLLARGVLEQHEHTQFEVDVATASDAAFARALRPARTRPPSYFADPPEFLRYPRLLPDDGRRQHVVLVTREYPPGPVNGIGRIYAAEARSLAARGHVVRVVTTGSHHDTVDFEEGVWVHRYVPRPAPPSERSSLPLPDGPASWTWTAREVVEAIDARRPVDVVAAPCWDSEGYAFLERRPSPFLCTLHTPLPTVMALDEHIGSSDPEALRLLVAAERRCIAEADAVLASGPWTIEEIERGHGMAIAEGRRLFAPHGLADEAAGIVPERPDGAELHLLFVGRLEPRKGVDVLAACLPSLLDEFPGLVVTLAGDDPHGIGHSLAGPRVRVTGRVDDDRLRSLYAGCDVFTAPSRYESFGLILLEAMMFAKPVVACRVGGMQTVVEHDVSGLLVDAGDEAGLREALASLLRSPERRAAMGAAARARYEAEYTEERMGDHLEAAVRSLSSRRSEAPSQ